MDICSKDKLKGAAPELDGCLSQAGSGPGVLWCRVLGSRVFGFRVLGSLGFRVSGFGMQRDMQEYTLMLNRDLACLYDTTLLQLPKGSLGA